MADDSGLGSRHAIAFELTKIILAKGGVYAADPDDYTKENVIKIYSECLAATDTSYKPDLEALL